MSVGKKRDRLKEGLFSRITWAARAIGVFWPSVVLVVLLFVLFCLTDIGRDVMLLALEARWTLPVVLIAAVFAAFTVWYSARLLGFFFLGVLDHAVGISVHLPRFMGFSVFTVLALGFSLPPLTKLPSGLFWILIAAVGMSFLWYRLLVRWAKQHAKAHLDKEHARRGLSRTTIGVLLCCAAAPVHPEPWYMVLCLLAAQFFFTWQVGARKEWAPLLATTDGWATRAIGLPLVRHFIQAAERRLDLQRVDPETRPRVREEVVFFTAFNLIALVALGLFIAADTSLSFAQATRPLPIVITGLAVVLGAINLLRLAGRVANVNVVFWLLAIAVLTGIWSDAHSVRVVPEDKVDERTVSIRPDFTDAAARWMRARLGSALQDSTFDQQRRIPMIFVLSDGGGARSARWVTQVMGRADSLSEGRFRHHLFCLSGASGGSVGNLTYYALLRKGVAPDSIGLLADRVTGADMLSFTVARMLGNDLLNLLCPVLGDTLLGDHRLLDDRAAAVEDGYAEAGRRVGLELDAPIIRWIDNDTLAPLFCINTTRVQDARPAVISSFDLAGDSAFSGRLDVLAEMVPGRTLSASSSAVLSARFPYVTPGGSIRMRCEPDSNGHRAERSDLFVDGGYFDNSGAGLVLEMLMELECNTRLQPLYRYFEPIVLHISNGDPREQEPERVNSVLNDLLAPAVTVVGAYGEQTDVNNLRLQRYLANSGSRWIEVNLFTGLEDEYYPMSWVMSEYPAQCMKGRVRSHPDMERLVRELASDGRWQGVTALGKRERVLGSFQLFSARKLGKLTTLPSLAGARVVGQGLLTGLKLPAVNEADVCGTWPR